MTSSCSGSWTAGSPPMTCRRSCSTAAPSAGCSRERVQGTSWSPAPRPGGRADSQADGAWRLPRPEYGLEILAGERQEDALSVHGDLAAGREGGGQVQLPAVDAIEPDAGRSADFQRRRPAVAQRQLHGHRRPVRLGRDAAHRVIDQQRHHSPVHEAGSALEQPADHDLAGAAVLVGYQVQLRRDGMRQAADQASCASGTSWPPWRSPGGSPGRPAARERVIDRRSGRGKVGSPAPVCTTTSSSRRSASPSSCRSGDATQSTSAASAAVSPDMCPDIISVLRPPATPGQEAGCQAAPG